MQPRRLRDVRLLSLSILLFCACPSPGGDSFYTPPAPLPAGQPGDLIRSRASLYSLDPVGGAPVPGVWSRQVLYLSESALGQPNAVSGTVLVPTAPWSGSGQRPLVSYAVGTRGVGDACAPSKTLATGTDYEGLFIQALLDLGWAVAITDYEGLGTPGMHTYVVGQSEGRAVLDMARAAQRLAGSGLNASTPVAVLGYSQGGGAAGWAGELAPSYAPELNLKAVAAGGVPGDLLATAEFVDGGPFVAVELLASLGLDAAYPELDLEDYLNTTGTALVVDASDACVVSFDGIQDIFSILFSSRSDFTHTDPLATPAWLARLDENQLGSGAPEVPVFQFHAVLDEIVPYGQAADVRRDWCDQGANVTWAPLVVAEHVLGMVQGQPLAIAFLANRFAGLPTFGNCWLP